MFLIQSRIILIPAYVCQVPLDCFIKLLVSLDPDSLGLAPTLIRVPFQFVIEWASRIDPQNQQTYDLIWTTHEAALQVIGLRNH